MSAAVVTEPIVVPTVTPPVVEPPKPEPETPTLTQSQVNALLAEERRKAGERATKDREQAEAKARESALAEQQKFQELAEQRAARITELESETARIETLTTERDALLVEVQAMVDEDLKAAPASEAAVVKKLPIIDQIAHVREHKASWQANRPQGGRETPRPAGNMSKDDLIQQEIEAQRAGRVRAR